MERHGILGNVTFLVVFLTVLFYNFYIFGPMFHALAFAAILAGSFYPLHNFILVRFKFRREYSALVTCLLIFVVIVLPFTYMGVQLSREAIGLYNYLKEGISEGWWSDYFREDGAIANLFDVLDLPFNPGEFSQMIIENAREASGELVSKLNTVVGNILGFLFQFILMFLAIYAFFQKGPELKGIALKMSPLPDSEEELIIKKFNQMNYVSLICNGIGGIMQGGLAGLGFWACGVPSVFLWTAVMTILAFIPLVGISIVSIPACLYLFAIKEPGKAITLLIYTSLVALIVENWFKPKFIGQRVKVNSLMLLFYIIAGMQSFGPAGIFYGPILCIVFLTLTEIFLGNYLPSWLKDKMP